MAIKKFRIPDQQLEQNFLELFYNIDMGSGTGKAGNFNAEVLEITTSTSEQAIPHKLGKAPQRMWIVEKYANTDVWFSKQPNAKMVYLTCSTVGDKVKVVVL